AWNEEAIPRRDWIAQGYFLRRSVTVVIGPGGSSKSTLMLTYAAGLACQSASKTDPRSASKIDPRSLRVQQ
ncbi:MAG: AAA family ATPase, partial [Rhodopila sp.]